MGQLPRHVLKHQRKGCDPMKDPPLSPDVALSHTGDLGQLILSGSVLWSEENLKFTL